MPGTIIKINIEEGSEVVQGQELLLLEAMKMHNPIVSTTDGKVTDIQINENDSVSVNQLLLVIE